MTRITLPATMHSKEAKDVIRLLGGDKQTRFVGGCVRNALLCEPTGDIDLATTLMPNTVMKRLKDGGIKVIPTGIDHGTVTAVHNGRVFEITTLRRDVETDGRRAVVEFTDNWTEDAARRDFTMNTLSADLAGNVYDPLGHGIADLKKGKVVFVGKPEERIAEDYLRILRFFRFHVRYGRGRPDARALNACRHAASKIKTLSKERVTQEFLKILAVSKCPPVLTLMRENNILKALIAVSYEEKLLTALIKKQKQVDEAARLLVVAGLKKSGIRKMEEALRLPLKTIRRMGEILDALKTLKDMSAHSVKLSLYRYGGEATVQALYIKNAPAKWAKLAETSDIPFFPVTGKDLLKQGHKPGPEMGKLLTKLERDWIRRGFK